jgi:hypothetical protein
MDLALELGCGHAWGRGCPRKARTEECCRWKSAGMSQRGLRGVDDERSESERIGRQRGQALKLSFMAESTSGQIEQRREGTKRR